MTLSRCLRQFLIIHSVSLQFHLDRSDLGHVDVDDLDVTTTGSGESQSDLIKKVTSQGYLRRQKLRVYSNDSVSPSMRIQEQAFRDEHTANIETIANFSNEIENNPVQKTGGKSNNPALDKIPQILSASSNARLGEASRVSKLYSHENGTCLKYNTCGAPLDAVSLLLPSNKLLVQQREAFLLC